MVRVLPPDEAAEHFIILLLKACKNVVRPWFTLPVARIDQPAGYTAYRERVYCYELYHQLRLLSETDGVAAGAPDYVLSGEIDKAGLKAMTISGREKPDLVWHIPGDSRHNAVVIEVKPALRWSHRGVVKDLETLSTFLSTPDRAYRRGVLLVFGETLKPIRDQVQPAVDDAKTDPTALQRAQLMWHQAPGDDVTDLGPIT